MYTVFNGNFEWKKNNNKYIIIKPKNSDESQFHHPPQDPSCNAHQLPKYKATTIKHKELLIRLIRKGSIELVYNNKLFKKIKYI